MSKVLNQFELFLNETAKSATGSRKGVVTSVDRCDPEFALITERVVKNGRAIIREYFFNPIAEGLTNIQINDSVTFERDEAFESPVAVNVTKRTA